MKTLQAARRGYVLKREMKMIEDEDHELLHEENEGEGSEDDEEALRVEDKESDSGNAGKAGGRDRGWR